MKPLLLCLILIAIIALVVIARAQCIGCFQGPINVVGGAGGGGGGGGPTCAGVADFSTGCSLPLMVMGGK